MNSLISGKDVEMRCDVVFLDRLSIVWLVVVNSFPRFDRVSCLMLFWDKTEPWLVKCTWDRTEPWLVKCTWDSTEPWLVTKSWLVKCTCYSHAWCSLVWTLLLICHRCGCGKGRLMLTAIDISSLDISVFTCWVSPTHPPFSHPQVHRMFERTAATGRVWAMLEFGES